MISPSLESLRTFLHILAAAVWTGGQITLASLVPILRSSESEVLPKVARSFAKLAWPALGILVITGMWSIFDNDIPSNTSAYAVTLGIKLIVVAVATAATAIH